MASEKAPGDRSKVLNPKMTICLDFISQLSQSRTSSDKLGQAVWKNPIWEGQALVEINQSALRTGIGVYWTQMHRKGDNNISSRLASVRGRLVAYLYIQCVYIYIV